MRRKGPSGHSRKIMAQDGSDHTLHGSKKNEGWVEIRHKPGVGQDEICFDLLLTLL